MMKMRPIKVIVITFMAITALWIFHGREDIEDATKINQQKQFNKNHSKSTIKETVKEKPVLENSPKQAKSSGDQTDGQQKDHSRAIRTNLWQNLESKLSKETKSKRLPDVIGIGAEKCGTHALYHFLKFHPLLRYPISIEQHFFERYHGEGVSKYINNMPFVEESACLMEKTPAYFSFPPYGIPLLVQKLAPNTKLLLIVCEPVRRAYSDFIHEKAFYEKAHGNPAIVRYNTFQQYVDEYLPKLERDVGRWQEYKKNSQAANIIRFHVSDYLSTILSTGLYALHLTRWLRYFNESNLLIINGEKMLVDPGSVIEDVQEFLGLPKALLREDYILDLKTGFFCFKDWKYEKLFCLPESKQRTRGNSSENISESTLQKLKEFYETHDKALFKMLNRTLW